MRLKRGESFSPHDEVVAGQLLAVAVALDSAPTDTSLLREYRIASDAYERRGEDSGGGAQNFAEFLATALARNTYD